MSNCNHNGACPKPLNNGICENTECSDCLGYPESKAVKTWEKDGLKLSIVLHTHYCGYVRFKKKPVRERGYEGFLNYVPVHGGITYAEADKNGMVYGFDCAHCDDWTPYTQRGHKWTEDEVAAETEKLAKGLLLASKYEARYLRNISNKGKAKVIDEYLNELGESYKALQNFGAMLNILSGKL